MKYNTDIAAIYRIYVVCRMPAYIYQNSYNKIVNGSCHFDATAVCRCYNVEEVTSFVRLSALGQGPV